MRLAKGAICAEITDFFSKAGLSYYLVTKFAKIVEQSIKCI